MDSKPIILVHGGAGDISDTRVTAKLNGVKMSVRAGYYILRKGGTAVDAVEAAVRSMELDDAFNAGLGSVLNIEGKVELEASIMNGQNLEAGCVTILNDIMHPISLARQVMEKTNHTFLGGRGAMAFAEKQKVTLLPAGSLVTEQAKSALLEFKDRQQKGLDTMFSRTELNDLSPIDHNVPGEPGTVGAVAIDAKGNIAAATSTGGITGKVAGRIGDTPLLGCGTYADNLVGGVSTTGHGETIMRFNLAQKILERLRYKKSSEAQEATKFAVSEMTDRLAGTGGAVTIDRIGRVGIYWTSKRMAWAHSDGDYLHYGIDHGVNYADKM